MKKIKIYNKVLNETTYINSIYELPLGWKIESISKATKEKMSNSAKKRGAPKCAFRNKKGINNPMYGKQQTIESKNKISETKKKKLIDNPNYGHSGKSWYTNGIENILLSKNDQIPDGWKKGRTITHV